MTKHQTHRWVDILPKVTESYNSTYHRSIKMAPTSEKERRTLHVNEELRLC